MSETKVHPKISSLKSVGPKVMVPSVKLQGLPTSIGSDTIAKKSVYAPSKSRSQIKSMPGKRIGLPVLMEKEMPSDIRVYNDAGEDVTPKPLLQDQGVRKNLTVITEGSSETPADMSQGSIAQMGTIAGPFTRSIFSASMSGRSTESMIDSFIDTTQETSSTWTDTKVEYKRSELTPDQLTESDLVEVVDLVLSETETIWMLDLPAVAVASESDEAEIIAQKNIRYRELSFDKSRYKNKQQDSNLTKTKAGNDRYVERSMNTFNEPLKSKATQSVRIAHNDIGVNASRWEMYDTYTSLFPAVPEPEEEEATIKVAAGEKDGEPIRETSDASNVVVVPDKSIQTVPEQKTIDNSVSQGTMSSVGFGESIFGAKDAESVIAAPQGALNIDDILKSETMARYLVVLERSINLNMYQTKQASYRGLPQQTDIDLATTVAPEPEKTKATPKTIPSDIGPSLDRLWAYQCPLTKGHNVSCISWNKRNPDLFAVGYGQFEYSKQKSGLVCCWSLKNPEFPERVYKTESGVLSIDFSKAHPNLLAAGMHNGMIAIYNVSVSGAESVLDNFDTNGKHTGPVWQLRWIEKERGTGEEQTEVLVSISTDGRVTQWAIRKGFESYDLMKMKRVSAKQQNQQSGKSKKNDAFISKYVGGLCFDFSQKDSNLYLSGTEDGNIHRCSCSYNEQYLDSYFGHTGPVYGLSWSPFHPDVFLSCSADWSVRLWHQERLQPVLNLFSSTKSVPSISWSPKVSTVFACVNEGAMEVWDLAQNSLDPILQNTPSSSDVKLTSITFATNSDCLLVGDSEGQVTVYQLRGMSQAHENQMEALQQVVTSCLASQLKN